MKKFSPFCAGALAILLLLPAAKIWADDIVIPPPRIVTQSPDARPRTVELVIQDHRFIPSAITLPPGERIILRVINKDDSAEEFESRYLKREKIIPGNSSVDIALGPLKPGAYDFIGEFHADTAQGRITVMQLGYGESYKYQD